MYKYAVTMKATFQKDYLIDADSIEEAQDKAIQSIKALLSNLPVTVKDTEPVFTAELEDNGTETAGSSHACLPCEWLPIDFAPKDGTEIIIRGVVNAKNNPFHNTPYITDIYQDWWDPEENSWARWPFHEFEPTHFMPIPPLKASDAE